ncbi:MAG: glycerol kinase GlpK [Planctomycetota bacterium]
MSHILALDQGTTSSRAIVYDGSLRQVASAQKEFTQHYPKPGWVEHDPSEIWSTQVGVAAEALERAGLGAADIRAVGIANQRETTIVWDRKTGTPIANAIVWQDRRTAEMCGRLVANGLEDRIRAKTGLVIDGYFSGTKIAWLLDHVEGARARAKRGELAFGTVDTWLIWKLTGGAVHATDPSNASRTLLYDIHAGVWDDELLELFGVPRSMLPEVRSSGGGFGSVRDGLPMEGAPIAGVLGDQQSATLGQVCLEPGMAKCTYGTGCFVLMNTGASPVPSQNRLLSTVAWEIDGARSYALEGSVFVGGAIVQWLRDGLGVIRGSADVEPLAASVPDSGGVMFVPALSGLGAPHWDPHARGTILGITRGTTAGHIARAALEGVAFQVAELVEAMGRDAGTPLTELRVDGGAASNDLLMQIQADLLGVPVVRPADLESTALGAASIAGIGSGLIGSPAELARGRTGETRFEPSANSADIESRMRRWRDATRRAAAWAERDS